MTIAAELAERIRSLRYRDLPEAAIAWTEIAFLDTVGVTLAGTASEAVALLQSLPGLENGPRLDKSRGPCLLFHGRGRSDPLNAALINGTAAHALDYDDLASSIGGHPSVPLVPALIALGETLGSSGAEIIVAYIAGFEAESRLGRAVNPRHYDKGWHPTATLGLFGTVAAAARLLGLDAPRTATALALATSFAAGLKANFGTMTKPLHVGHSARDGIMAALLAQRGFTAAPDAFEHRQGFFQVYDGVAGIDRALLLDGWGDPLEIVDPGLGLKQFPCCGSTHSAIEAMLALRRDHAPAPDQVRAIEILANPRRLPHATKPAPRTGLEAKFSIQYVSVMALLDGAVTLAHFEDAAVLEPAVQDLLPRVSVGAHPDMPAESDNQFGAEVAVILRDGRRLSHRIDHRLGCGPDRPMSREELWDKFSDCAGRVLAAEGIRPLFEMLARFREVERIGDLTALIARAAKPTAQAASGF